MGDQLVRVSLTRWELSILIDLVAGTPHTQAYEDLFRKLMDAREQPDPLGRRPHDKTS